MKMNRNIAITLVCAILGVMLAWQYQSIDTNQKLAGMKLKRAEELKDDLILEKKKNDDLRKKIDELSSKKQEYEEALGNFDLTSKSLSKELDSVKIIAGLVTVKGKGVIITIDSNDFVNVEDTDILNVINELRASDVQAISVNEERIIATSEVRLAGKYIMVNGRQMLRPFVIKSIAEPEKVERSLKIVNGVVDRLRAYQLKVTLEKSDNIVIPKVKDDVIKTDLLTPVK